MPMNIHLYLNPLLVFQSDGISIFVNYTAFDTECERHREQSIVSNIFWLGSLCLFIAIRIKTI